MTSECFHFFLNKVVVPREFLSFINTAGTFLASYNLLKSRIHELVPVKLRSYKIDFNPWVKTEVK